MWQTFAWRVAVSFEDIPEMPQQAWAAIWAGADPEAVGVPERGQGAVGAWSVKLSKHGLLDLVTHTRRQIGSLSGTNARADARASQAIWLSKECSKALIEG